MYCYWDFVLAARPDMRVRSKCVYISVYVQANIAHRQVYVQGRRVCLQCVTLTILYTSEGIQLHGLEEVTILHTLSYFINQNIIATVKNLSQMKQHTNSIIHV